MSPTSSAPSSAAAAGGGMDLSQDLKRHACSAFLAGDENVRMVPNFSYNNDKMELISRASIGPLVAGIDTVVPLWLAILLRQRNMARILPPAWMDVQVLRGVLLYEKDPANGAFCPDLPFRYAELARSILAVESEIEQADQIRILLEDIATVRMDKIRGSLHSLSVDALSKPTTLPIINVTHIGSLEIATFRPFITQAFRDHLMLSRKTTPSQQKKSSSTEETRSEALRASRKSNIGDSTGADGDDDDEIPVKRGRSRIRRFR